MIQLNGRFANRLANDDRQIDATCVGAAKGNIGGAGAGIKTGYGSQGFIGKKNVAGPRTHDNLVVAGKINTMMIETNLERWLMYCSPVRTHYTTAAAEFSTLVPAGYGRDHLKYRGWPRK